MNNEKISINLELTLDEIKSLVDFIGKSNINDTKKFIESYNLDLNCHFVDNALFKVFETLDEKLNDFEKFEKQVKETFFSVEVKDQDFDNFDFEFDNYYDEEDLDLDLDFDLSK